MHTVLTRDPAAAAGFIKNGGTCAFPTETVYGLGANAFDKSAVAKIFEAKQRPADNPLIAHISDLDQIRQLASEITPSAEKLIEAFFPGPLTVVLPKEPAVPMLATAGLETIGIRMPSFSLAHKFLELCGVPVVAPSANLSGRPSPTTWQAVYEDLNGRIDCLLQGDATEIGLESTVVDCTSQIPILLRLGSVSIEQIRTVVPELAIAAVDAEESARSPGMKHRHYSPKGDVILVDSVITDGIQTDSAYIGLNEKVASGHFVLAKCCKSIEDYAHSLFEFFRECDRRGIATIYCQIVPEIGIGSALMDRLRRAAEE
jgi:L-threonylcarbamoyladenylate synthase